MLRIDPSRSRVVIETEASGLLARVAHDLSISAPIEHGASTDGASCELSFAVRDMKVSASRRHGTEGWGPPSPSDANDIEARVVREVFGGCPSVAAWGKLHGESATLTVRAQREQTVSIPIHVERSGPSARARGQCELSLRLLGTGKVRVPFGAIQLADRVTVSFDLVLTETND
jgi:hypothetical protein